MSHNRQRIPKMCMLIQLIQAQIRSLYDVSSLLRRPMTKDEYVRSNVDRKKSKIVDETSLRQRSRPFDRDYVWEMIGQWHGQIDLKKQNVAALDQPISITSIENNSWFFERLATANTRRREQLEYWRKHTGKFTHPSSSNLPRRPQRDQKNVVEADPSPEEQIYPDSSSAKQTPASIGSLSTEFRSYIYDSNAGDRSRTVYEPTSVGQTQSGHVPDIPELARRSDTFPCPYCGMELVSEEMRSQGPWT
jgi:hypothetical protein